MVLERPSSFWTREGRFFFQATQGALAKLGASFEPLLSGIADAPTGLP